MTSHIKNSRGKTADCPSRPHTDPDMRNDRIRLFNNIVARVNHNALIPVHKYMTLPYRWLLDLKIS